MPDLTPHPTGDAIRINEHTPLEQREPVVTELSNGNVLQVWTSINQPGDDSGWGIVGRIFERQNDGTFIAGDEFLVNQTIRGDQFQPTVAALDDGGFIIGWVTFDFDVASINSSVWARVYSSSDVTPTPVGGEFIISSGDERQTDQFEPEVTVSHDADGNVENIFFVYTTGDTGSFGTDRDVYGQLFPVRSYGAKVGYCIREDFDFI